MEKVKSKKLLIVLAIIVAVFSVTVFVLSYFGIPFKEMLMGKENAFCDVIRFVSVGDGYGIILQSNGSSAVIDFGPDTYGGNNICNSLMELNITEIDYGFITYTSNAHIGGFTAVKSNFNIKNVVSALPHDYDTSSSYGKYLFNLIEDNNIRYFSENAEYTVGNFTVSVIYYNNLLDASDRSAVLKITNGKTNAVYFSDITTDADAIYKKLNFKADIISLPTQNNDYVPYGLIDVLRPKYLVVSSEFNKTADGNYNEMINDFGIKPLKTYEDGNITFYIKDGEIENVYN